MIFVGTYFDAFPRIRQAIPNLGIACLTMFKLDLLWHPTSFSTRGSRKEGMTHHRLGRYTILISCTGRKPIVLSFHPTIAFLTLVLSTGLPIAAFSTVCFYVQQNTQLAQRNSQLTQEADNILERLETLETKIDAIKDGQGSARDSGANSSLRLQVGSTQAHLAPVDEAAPEVMLSIARDKIPNLLQLLQRKTQPILKLTASEPSALKPSALTQTALREVSRPTGMPIAQETTITSLFGLRSDASGWGYELHQGIDFVAAYGSAVQATAPGRVEKAGWDQGFGNRVVIDHGYGYRTLYAHLDQLLATEGMTIDRHQIIGYLGNTGRSREPHLHYGVYRNGYVVDPKDYLN